MSLFKSASMVSLFTLASRVTGLLREILMASAFGASALTDAFNVAFRIPNMLRRLFAEGAFSQAFVPVLARTRAAEGEDAAQRMLDAVANTLLVALILTTIVGVAVTPLIVWAMAGGFSHQPHVFDAAVVMTRIMFPYIAFMSLIALAAGVLNTYKHFAIPAVTPVLLNVAMIGAAIWGAPAFLRWGIQPIYAMAAGVMVGGVLQLALMLWALKTQAIWPKFALSPRVIAAHWTSDATKTIVTRMLPALLGVSVAQISLLINTHIASRIGAGSVSWLSYADRLMEFPVALLGVALGVVLVPQLSAAQAKGDTENYKRMLDWGLRWVLLLGLPSAVALMVFAEPLVATLFHHGKFSVADVQQTALAVAASGVGLLGMVAIKVLAPGYFAKDDTKTPALIAVVVLILTQILNVVFVPHWAHGGLALSIAIGALINATWLLVGLLRRGAFSPQPGWGMFVLQVIAACALLAVVLITARTQIDWLGSQWGGALLRAAGMVGVLAVAAAVYFGALAAGGLKLRSMLRH